MLGRPSPGLSERERQKRWQNKYELRSASVQFRKSLIEFEFKNAAMDPVSLAVSQSCINPAGMSPEWFEPQSEQRMNLLMMTDGSYERNCDKTCFGMQDFCESLGRCKSLFHLVGEKTKSFLKLN